MSRDCGLERIGIASRDPRAGSVWENRALRDEIGSSHGTIMMIQNRKESHEGTQGVAVEYV